MRNKPGDKVRLKHMLDAIREIESYLIGINLDTFLKNSMVRFACIKQMEIIGEAGNHVSEETKSTHPSIEWQQITGLRNVLVHQYFGIDLQLVWEIVKKDIPALKQKIIAVLRFFEE